MPRRVTWLDVFTATPLAGNGLAVLHDADDLDAETMQAVARETRLSETTFVQSADAEGADYRNRVFTTLQEMPFAGHPSLGTAVAVARVRGESSARYVQQTHAGLQPIEVELAGERARASMLQEPARFGPEADPGEVLRAAGLRPDDAHPELPPQVVSTGAPHVMAPVRDAAALARAAPERPALAAVLERLDAIVLYLVALAPAGGRARARGFFLDPVVVLEDPATGSAAGTLLAYLAGRGLVSELAIEQGVEMGRPSLLRTALEGDRVRVGGDVVVLAEGQAYC